TAAELAELRAARDASGRVLVVGFNRRHAPLALTLRDHVCRAGMPFQLLYRVSAGRLPDDHWLNDLDEGGGRLLGEGCHFVDFACWLAGAPPVRVAATLAGEAGRPLAAAQSFGVALGGELAQHPLELTLQRRPGRHVEEHRLGLTDAVDDAVPARGDDRARRAHAFDHRERLTLELACRQRDDVGAAKRAPFLLV